MVFGERVRRWFTTAEISIKSPQELKSAIVTTWLELSKALLGRNIAEWRRRLENVVQCNGEHNYIKHVWP